jgi:FkbM family methyltransferase
MCANHLESDPAQAQQPTARRHDVVPHASEGASRDHRGPVYEVRTYAARIFEGTDSLLSRARMQWQFGDWRSLLALDLLAIEHHPARAELALLSGCAALQVGQRDTAKRFLSAAESWGCHPELMARLLISGVANSLGRYHALKGNSEASEAYFVEAASGLGGDPLLAARARRHQELLSLQPALNPAPIPLGTRLVSTPVASAIASAPLLPSHVGPETFPIAEAEANPFAPGIRSYAQNFEDVILWRALKHVEGGFYIDVGAQHPLNDSVSKAFYERGWRGIHVEATPSYAKLLRQDRPDETVVEAALSNQHGSITFFEIPETGLSTGDAEIADRHQRQGFKLRETTVSALTLSDVFALVGEREVHWLKIDVEGMEKQAIESWGDHPNRPWIVVVESTVPNTRIPSHQDWELILIKKGYSHVYFDGLSRFYISNMHGELLSSLTLPPNVFDNFSVV